MAGTGVLPREGARGAAPSTRPPRPDLRRAWWRAHHSLWFTPLLGAAVGTLLAVVLVQPPAAITRLLAGVPWRATPAEARTALSTLLGIALTSLSIILSLSMLVVQNIAGQYSPRLLRLYLRDTGIRTVIPVFVATTAYCVVAVHGFGHVAEGQRLPRPALSGAMLLLICCAAALVYQVLHTLRLLRVENLVCQVARTTLRVAHRLEKRRQHDAALPASPPRPSPESWPLRAPRDGFVVDVEEAALLAQAEARGLVVHVDVAIGEPVLRGAVIGRVEPGPRSLLDARAVSESLTRALVLDTWRDLDADIALGVRQLVDVAIKALSPGINDPYTAVEALDQLTIILCELCQLRLGSRVLADGAGRPRVFLRAPTLEDYLTLATDQIARYGAAEPAVSMRLLRLAGSVGQHARTHADRRAALDTLHRVYAGAERALASSPSLDTVRNHAREQERALEGAPPPPLPVLGF